MDTKRVVDLVFPGDYGSGYLITNRLVLTARHVGAVEGKACLVRGLPPEVGADRPEWPGVVHWVSADIDAALVRLDDPLGFLPQDPVYFMDTPREAGSWICQAKGFPRAQMEGERRVDWLLEGRLSWAAAADGNWGRYDISGLAPPQDPARGYAGMSGAAVFVGPVLAGIVRGGQAVWDGKTMQAAPTALLFRNGRFCELLDDDAAAARRWLAAAGEDGLSRRITPYVCMIDRDKQYGKLDALLRSLAKWGPVAPKICSIHAYDADLADRFIERICGERSLQPPLISSTTATAITELEWRQWADTSGTEDAVQDMLGDLDQAFDLDLDPADRRARLREALDEQKITAVWWRVRLRDCGPGQKALLEAWLQLWRDLGQGHPVLMILVLEHPDPADDTAYRGDPGAADGPAIEAMIQAMETTSGPITALDRLQEIRAGDARRWIEAIAARPSGLQPDDLAQLRLKVEGALAQPLRMAAFQGALDRIMGSQT